MTKPELEAKLEKSIDSFATIEHERWAHWQRYMHSQSVPQADGSLLVPADLVARWQSQMDRSFAELSEKERESDREQVRKYHHLLTALLTDEGTSPE